MLQKIEQFASNIRIVLVETSHPGNIGAAARAMKTMGLRQLVLVNPQKFPHQEAMERASSADDVLDAAVVVDDLKAAIQDCELVIGTSARPRGIPLPGVNARECANVIGEKAVTAPVALVFGRESSGLTNQELEHCHYHVTIPTNPEYCSLNLAAAVQVLCYEIRMAAGESHMPQAEYDRNATAAEIEHFYQHLEQVLQLIGFIRPSNPKKIMQRLRRLFNRVPLEHLEVKILRGILSAMQDHKGA